MSVPGAGNVAIIGAGPAGLACAYYLAVEGVRSTVFEALPEGGGMAAVGIPDYRLPRQVLQDEVGRVETLGVEIRYNQRFGVDISFDDLFTQGYEAVFVGVGAHQSARMGCEGEDAGYEASCPGVEFLREVAFGRTPLEGGTMVVIGGGNVAMDCVRSARRLGFDDVRLLYRRTEAEMPADAVEIAEAKEEGVAFHTLVAPVRIIAQDGRVVGLECRRMELGEPDSSGRRRPEPVEGSEFVMDCDAIVPAIGQVCRVDELVPDTVAVSKWKTLEVDPLTMQSADPRVFGGGDCFTGPSSLVAALAAGRRAARSIVQFCRDGAVRRGAPRARHARGHPRRGREARAVRRHDADAAGGRRAARRAHPLFRRGRRGGDRGGGASRGRTVSTLLPHRGSGGNEGRGRGEDHARHHRRADVSFRPGQTVLDVAREAGSRSPRSATSPRPDTATSAASAWSTRGRRPPDAGLQYAGDRRHGHRHRQRARLSRRMTLGCSSARVGTRASPARRSVTAT